MALEIEYREHIRAGVSSCKFIRPLLDVIPGVSQVPQGLVFRWMEHNLYDFDPEQYQQDYVLPEAVTTGVLQALVPFENNRRIHSGWMVCT